MDGRNWGQFLIPYTQAVEELKVKFRALRNELKQREEFSPIEFVTGRVKRVSSILAKAKRLNVSLENLEYGIEDIAGIRIMCQFVEDIWVVAKLIRSREDMIVVYEKDYVNEQKESGYRSFHMIVEYPVQSALGTKRIFAEIQIRTLSMNFWATIEHSLNYKFKESLPEQIRIRLKKAAEAAFQLDKEMSSIREQIVASQSEFEDHSSIVSSILNAIQVCYFHQLVHEATAYQARFNELWENNDYDGLRQLKDDIVLTLLENERD